MCRSNSTGKHPLLFLIGGGVDYPVGEERTALVLWTFFQGCDIGLDSDNMGMGVEEMGKEDRAEEKKYDWLEGLFCRLVMRESGKETQDALGLEGGWRCLMDGGLDTGVAKGRSG